MEEKEKKKKITGNKTDRLLFREYIYIYISGLEILAGLTFRTFYTRAKTHSNRNVFLRRVASCVSSWCFEFYAPFFLVFLSNILHSLVFVLSSL